MESRFCVFTAVDGTLLDERTLEAGANRATLRRLRRSAIPVIPMSGRTLGEMAPIAADLELRHAMVIEAGGAIARWKRGGWEVEPCGPPADTFLQAITDIEDRSGASLLVCSATDKAAPARPCFSEPFLIESGELESIRKAAAELGFSIRRGRRFFHLCRKCDEGTAFTRLRKELRCDIAIGIGGSAIDAEFLTRTEIAIVVPGADGRPDRELLAKRPDAHVAPAPGPAGWAVAVEKALRADGT